jgi:U3 small nucleolar ribonucleoprotein protein LCP5
MDSSLPTLLESLTASLESAAKALPTETTIVPPKDGISLLDVKNELLLSYVQNLVFLILLKLRSQSSPASDEYSIPTEDIVKKLAELRVYLEKGVRPLEARLKYQIDKVVKVADDASRSALQKSQDPKPSKLKSRSRAHDNESDFSGDNDSGSEGSDSVDEDINELAYRPNPAAFVRPKASVDAEEGKGHGAKKDGIYRPPRVTPTAMPMTRGKEVKDSRRPLKSNTLDEFIATELSSAPVAQPSIGSTIVAGGRHTKSQRERDEEGERRTYEESNFVRLPKESKKERAKKGSRTRDLGYGGEDWRGLDAGVDRIAKLTQRKGDGGGTLASSRKREIVDGPRGTGESDLFERKRRKLDRRR